jgi:hypothetical protein
MKLVALPASVCAAVAVCASSAEAAVRWFHSPSGNISCEVSTGNTRGPYAYCAIGQKPKTVELRASGRMTICNGIGCLSNAPENAFTLAYGRSTSLGPFRCTSLVKGMRCVVTRSGHGFLISRERIISF